MMRHFSRTSILSLLALGSLSSAPYCFAQESNDATARAEAARHEMAVRDARQSVQEARLAYQARRYSDAVEHYRAALASLPNSPSTQSFARFVKDCLSDALIAKAIDYRLVGRRDEAISFLREAISLSPSNKRAEVELTYTMDAVRTNPALTPQHLGDVAEVTRLLELGYGQLDLGKYDEAIATFRQISQYDKYNSAAQQGIEAATNRKIAALKDARNAVRADMLADVDKTWDKLSEDMAPKDMEVAPTEGDFQALDGEVEDAIATSIMEMKIPNIVFEDAGVMDVLEALQNQIRRFESTGTRAGRNINLTTNFGKADSPGYKEIMSRTITLKLTDVSVKEILDILSSQLGTSYYYTPTGVEISFSGKDFGPLIDRTFTVPPHFFDPSDAEESDEDDAFEEEGARVTVHRVNPVQSLKSMGISFPEGATARYSSSTRQLHVRNTAYNMEDIQDLLDEPMTEERQVVLNVIMMEVSENDLEQLGFDWLFNVNINGEYGVGGGADNLASSATGIPIFQGYNQPQQGGAAITSGLRSGTEALSPDKMEHLISSGGAAEYHGGAAARSPYIFGIRGVWSSVDVTFMMNGLSQKKGVDLLRNPRLIFSPGMDEQVTFADVTEMFFPETWEPSEMATFNGNNWNNNNNNNNNNNHGGSGSSVATGAIPSDFVRFGMVDDAIGGFGTILQVHSAEISESGEHVTLALTSTTNEFEGFINWGSPINSASWTESGKVEYIQLSPNYILQPMIKRYVENTKITLVPGSVMVMGGLKEAKHVRFEDKVPVIGDLPLVGRLFRSEGEQKIRKALIYFVKVDVVDPTGRDVRTGERPSSVSDNF
ncbi:MAG: hypothetical protein IJB64_01585 [Akkermansia sp.]|nr:hypothetical protein [Akkermansia sp.]